MKSRSESDSRAVVKVAMAHRAEDGADGGGDEAKEHGREERVGVEVQQQQRRREFPRL